MIPHNSPSLGPEEEQAALRVLRSGWLAQGEEVAAFEREFCAFLGLPEGHAVAVSSGSAALFLALWSLGGAGKRVAFPGYVCSALRHATALAGAREHVLDTASGSPNVEMGSVRACGVPIAIIPHMYGLPLDVSDAGGVDIIEDCAQALGARVDGAPVGLQGRVGVFSFYATKLLTSGGQGGMVASRDKILIDAVRDYRRFDCRRDDRRRFNLQMTDLQAAVGREQLKKLPGFLSRRETIFKTYRDSGLPLLDVPPAERARLSPVRYRAVVMTDGPGRLIESLARRGVTAIVPVEDWELLGDPESLPNARELSHRTVSIPLYPALSDQDVRAVAAGVLEG
jgi:perosamine synthetase